MQTGPRHYRSAMLRIAMCAALPDHMRDGTREILGLQCSNPRKGYATRLMLETCREADEAGIVLIVQPGQFDDGMTTEQLTKWYERFGFVALPSEGAPVMARMRYGKPIDMSQTIGVDSCA